MAERIIHFEVEGKTALGFDTGLSSQAFAQAKLVQFITQEGLIVYPDGKTEPWKPSAVIERQGQNGDPPSMVIWGPDFKGERFDLLLGNEKRRDEALDALRLWIEARSSAKFAKTAGQTAYPETDPQISLWPAGTLVNLASGVVLFPPEGLVIRSFQAEGGTAWLEGAESLVNTELAAEDAESFTAGAILYRIMSGALPFPNRDRDLLHQDIREGVFLPLRLAAPGLDEKTTGLVEKAIASSKNTSVFAAEARGRRSLSSSPEKVRPGLDEFRELLGPVHSRGVLSFFHILNEAEQVKIAEEREQFQKKKNLTVNTRRFVIRNAALIMGICAAVIGAALITRSIVINKASLPTTAGMESVEVVQSYYGAFGDMDHDLMDACVIQKAGKGDIEMVMNFFVINRVRQAYESTGPTTIPAQKWLDSGAGPTKLQVFGVSDLEIRKTGGNESGDEIHYRSSYILWFPNALDAPEGAAGAESANPINLEDPGAEIEAMLPKGYPFTDELKLIRVKGNWRIAEINREVN
ncbi:hypothetical protein AGMMS50255_5970 [Spirochaetia bacterium]|nr:hypothetical protein AGMMS50255_5970 [Spirochaetia bacterium]